MRGQRDQGLQPLKTLGERLREAARRDGERIAFIDGSERLTYAQWDARSDEVAAAAWDAGARPGEPVAVMLPSSVAFPIVSLALAKIGAVTAAINPRLGARETQHILTTTGARLAIADRELSVRTLPVAAALAATGKPPSVDVGHDDPVAIVFTTGSTGDPKGATFTHAALDAVARIEGQMDHEDAPVRLQSIPMAHMQFMTKVGFGIDLLATTVLLPRWTARDALGLIEAERVTSFGGIPTQLQLMLMDDAFAGADLSSLRSCTLGGAPATRQQVEQFRAAFGVPVFVRYSCTELALITGTRAGDPDEVVATTVGRPLPEVDLLIERPGDDGVGEVTARNPAMMRGYWGEEPHSGHFRTGDLGRLDGDNLVLVGRRKEMYIRGGYNVYPVEVEQVLRSHPGVAMAAVVGIPDEVLGERGAAFVVPRDPGDPPSSEDLKAFVKERIADYKVPDLVELRGELPLNATFKVDKAALRAAHGTR